MPPDSWTFRHHPIVCLHALDQTMVTDLCRLIVKVERGEELGMQEQVWMRAIHREIREGAHGHHETTGS